MKINETIKKKLEQLPSNSGVYIMRDAEDKIIYIGKAVVLKNRVRQYFNNSEKPVKVQAMVDNVADFDYIITFSEKDAFALESTLVKKHMPKYNILLKDDKSSPYIRIDTRADFPAIEVTRKPKRDGARYFGPYFNGVHVWEIVNIIKSAYGMRTCKSLNRHKHRECLNYHIKLCTGACSGKISKEEYAVVKEKVIAFLSGKDNTAEKLIIARMNEAVECEEFERAIQYREQLKMLEKVTERSVVNLGKVLDIDCFYYVTGGEYSVISLMIIRAGKLIGSKEFIVTGVNESEEADIVGFITQYYGSGNEVPQEICLQSDYEITSLKEYLTSISSRQPEITVPKIGAKFRLMEMARINALDYLTHSTEKYRKEYDNTYGATERLRKLLNLKSARRLECFDISNISGTDKVASQAVFIDGAPAKQEYRRYRIKTVEGSDDYKSLSEAVTRRLERLKSGDEKFEQPDLIIIDGGKGQLSASYAAMKAVGFDIPMISLAEREEEIFLTVNTQPLILSKNDIALRLLQRIRDEAHRFAINYHRNLRMKRIGSELAKINGVGKKRQELLLREFPDYSEIKNASVEKLMSVKGIDKKVAENIQYYFREKNKQGDNK